MADPIGYSVLFNYTSYQSNAPTSPLPAVRVDADLAGISTSITSLVNAVKDVRRSDGALKNGIVDYDSLSTALQSAGLAPLSAWATDTDYLVSRIVTISDKLYTCLVSHTSDVFATDLAAGNWEFLIDLPTADVGAAIDAATAKTTPVDADKIPLIDSAASNELKKVTWADIKTTLKTYFDSATSALTNKSIDAANNTITNIATSMFAANVVDTDGTLAADSDTRLASQKATKTYVDALIAANDAMVFKGVQDCSANPNYPAADRGHTYRVSVAGKIGGASGVDVEAGDIFICITDSTAAGDHAAVGANWGVVQVNIDGAVVGPSSTVDSNAASFDGTTGKLIKDSGKALPAGTIVGTSDAQTISNKIISGASNTLTVREADLSLSDITTGNATASQHGLLKKLPNVETQFMNGLGNWATPAGSGGAIATPPQSRITLTTGVAVPISDVSGATAHYYTPAVGRYVPLWNGSSFEMTDTGGELSQLTTDITKSPAAVAADKVYYLFVWNDSGTMRCTRGPAWASDTDPGTGAGTSEIEWLNGFPVNKVAITNGPAARAGFCVGAVRSNSSSQLVDTAARRWVSNAFNTATRFMRVAETTDSWNYTTDAWRQANASAANQIDWLHAFDGSMISASVRGAASNTGTNYILVAIGIDNATAPAAGFLAPLFYQQVATLAIPMSAEYLGYAGRGRHYATWLERSQAAGTTTWYGDGGATLFQSGIHGFVLN